MAQSERAGQKKHPDAEQKARARQDEAQPSSGGFHAWEQGAADVAETPFWPRMGEHAELLATTHSDERRAGLVLRLQQTYGNRYVQRLIASMGVQAKLTVSQPGHIYEQEADSTAEKIVRAVDSPAQRQPEEEEEIQAKSANTIQRQAGEQEEEIQTKATDSQSSIVSEDLETHINNARGGGHPLPDTVRAPMEPAFGADFSGIRVHSDPEADRLNKQLGARAFTFGKDIFFAQDEYSPTSSHGRRLIAHELTHTIQQDASNRISRAMTGMVIEKTHLRKPNKDETAPKKGPKLFNMLGPAVESDAKIELLDTKYPAGNPVWQLAVHPVTKEKGFVRISKVMARGTEPPKSKEIKLPPGKEQNEIAKELADAISTTFLGAGNLGGQEGAVEQAANMLLVKRPDIAWKADFFKEPDGQKELKKLVEQDCPWLGSVLAPGTKAVGLGAGLFGEAFGGLAGLIGMAQGMGKLADKKADFSERLEGLFAVGKGWFGALAGGVGASGKAVEVAKEVVGAESPLGKIAESAAGFLAPVADAIKMVKSLVEAVVVVIKGFGTVIDRAKKGVKTETTEIWSGVVEFATAAFNTVSSALKSAAGVLKWLKMLPGVAVILGIVSSIVDIVSGVCDFFKNVIDAVKLYKEMKENKETTQKIEKNEEYVRTERNMGNKMRRLAETPIGRLKLTDEGKPDLGQIEDVLKEYEGRDKEDKTEPTERDYADVKRYLVDRHLLEILKKRLSRGFSRIPEFVLDFTAAGVTIIGGLASVISDIGGILSAPSGIGAGIAALAKTVAAVASGVLSGILKATKSGYQLVRKAVRKVKQYGRDKGWWGDKTKTTAAKQERYKRDIIRIMQSVADLKDYDPSDEASKAVYARAKLQLEATGVNLQELFAENGKPLEQAKLIYKAMVKRE